MHKIEETGRFDRITHKGKSVTEAFVPITQQHQLT
ncbi:hypothetical protein GGR06_001117 [Bacteroides reticulotermitis]|uniref:Uncharacterized protein n=1 Tax=Bacteroides reticulotermitis TaxID=1133319 RepID=A0A840CTY5_9BACE|nr:hypothetical protein [Bacteroides reticulotermitis]